MRPKSLDLIAVSAIALLTLVVAFTSFKTSLETSFYPFWFLPFGILMVLVLPGYSIIKGLLPQLDWPSVLLLSLGISISVDIIGALFLNYILYRGLQPTTWAVWLSSITLLGCLSAALSRSSQSQELQVSLPSVNWKNVLSFFLAGSIIIAAIFIAREESDRIDSTFTQLWALPVTNETAYSVQVGIHNFEGRVEHYDLYVESQGLRIAEWPEIVLSAGEDWTVSVPLAEKPVQPVRVLLYKVKSPNEIYRVVQVAPIAFDVMPTPMANH